MTNVFYKNVPGYGDLEGDLAWPDGGGPFPGIVLVHGGGFVGGDKSKWFIEGVVQTLAARGFASWAIDYRLAEEVPEGDLSGQIQDVIDATTWLYNGAGGLAPIDGHRIGMLGSSAGAVLACLTAIFDPRVKGYVSWSGNAGADPAALVPASRAGFAPFLEFHDTEDPTTIFPNLLKMRDLWHERCSQWRIFQTTGLGIHGFEYWTQTNFGKALTLVWFEYHVKGSRSFEF